MVTKSKRNGTIELFRFIFCIGIIFHHIGTRFYGGELVLDNNFKFFCSGYIGVEFFFLVSGFLLAKSAMKKDESKAPLGSQTVTFMKGKILSLAVPHTIAFFVAFITGCIVLNVKSSAIPLRFFNSLPCLFFLQKSGIPYISINSVEWYICSMLLCMIIIYPLCKKYQKTYTNIIAPFLGIVTISYLVYKYGTLTRIKVYDIFTYKCNIRAFAEINLGVCAFAISEKIKNLNYTRFDKFALTIIEAACYIFTLYYSLGYLKQIYDVYALMALFVAIIITFSNTSLFANCFNNKFIYFLGKLSLHIYLIQVVAKDLIIMVNPNISENVLVTIITSTIVNIVLGIALMYISVPFEKILTNKLKKLNKIDTKSLTE